MRLGRSVLASILASKKKSFYTLHGAPPKRLNAPPLALAMTACPNSHWDSRILSAKRPSLSTPAIDVCAPIPATTAAMPPAAAMPLAPAIAVLFNSLLNASFRSALHPVC